jgi:ParB family transcriptional regulator, chromosome partitioning protein
MSLNHQSEMIPLHKLKPSDANVRKTGREAGIEELAASIAAHGLLHPLTVAPEIGRSGQPNGKFGVVAGGRRFAALRLLVQQNRLPKDAPIPCLPITDAGVEVSLAENVTQAPMHPADQYEAFATLHLQGMTAEDIGARFGIAARAVKQRLRLGAASPVLIALYRAGDMTLDQLMAFCLTDDHAMQERVWGSLSYNKEPYLIRRLLTEDQVPYTDRRAVFVGLEAYEASGGVITRDLFSQDEGQGFIADPALLEQLVGMKLEQIAEAVRREGWKWVNVSLEFDNSEVAGMQRVFPTPPSLTEEQEIALDALETELETFPEGHPDFEAESERLDAAIEALRGEARFDPDHLARGGAWVSLGRDRNARIDRGYIRPQDIAPLSEEDGGDDEAKDTASARIFEHPAQQRQDAEPDVAEMPARLLSDLTAHRTAALRHGLATRPDIAYLAVLHAFALQSFYFGDTRRSCLDVVLRHPELAPWADHIDANEAHRAMAEQHTHWGASLSESPADLWQCILDLIPDDRAALLAHCAALTLDALRRPGESRYGKHTHADQLAMAVGLDMTAFWHPTAEAYLSRVKKAQILEAVREAKGDAEADRMATMKKPDMAARAERLLVDSGWLPPVLRGASAAPDAAKAAAAA